MTQTHISTRILKSSKNLLSTAQTDPLPNFNGLHGWFWPWQMCPPLPVLSPGPRGSKSCYSTSSRQTDFLEAPEDVQAGTAPRGLQPRSGPKPLSPAPKSGAREANGGTCSVGNAWGQWGIPSKDLDKQCCKGERVNLAKRKTC